MGMMDYIKRAFDFGQNQDGTIYAPSSKFVNFRDVNLYNVDTTPILDSIYTTIAKEISKTDFLLVKSEGDKVEHQTNNSLYEVLTLRPNKLQTKTQFWHTFVYQLLKNGNAVAYINRNSKGITSFEIWDTENFEFGYGYQLKNGEVFIKVKDTLNNQILLVDYMSLIHVRSKPNSLFSGDRLANYSLRSIVKLVDDNLSSLITDISQNGTKTGIVKLGNVHTGLNASIIADEDSKIAKQAELQKRIQSSGSLLVLDDGEEFIPLNREFKTAKSEDVDYYTNFVYDFYGLNKKIINGTCTNQEYEMFYKRTVAPILEDIVDELNYKCLTPTARSQKQSIVKFRNPFEFMAPENLADAMYKMGDTLSKNERRKFAWNLSGVSGGDIVLDNKNFTDPNNPESG